MQLRTSSPTGEFAEKYLEESKDFLEVVQSYRLNKTKLETV
jgi:hypothetical protein